MSNESVYFTVYRFESFRRAFLEADASRRESFRFEGREYDTKYAKYLVEYMTLAYDTPPPNL